MAIGKDGDTVFDGITSGNRIIHIPTGKSGWLDEATHDGDAFISLDDGTFKICKWKEVKKEKT